MSNRKHSIRMLGLALVAVFAMSAVAASAASAAQFHAGASPASATATNEGAHVFTAGQVGNISCSTATFKGELVTTPASTLEVLPTYSSCTFLGLPTTVNMNGCKYLFNTPTGSPFTGTVSVRCPKVGGVRKVITFEVGACKVEVPGHPAEGLEPAENQGLGTVTYTNNGSTPNRSVTVAANVTGIKYTATGVCNEFPGTRSDGHYVGTAHATAEDETEVEVEAWIE